MDNSKEFQLMLDAAIKSEPLAFKSFDRTKNVQDQLQEMYRNSLPQATQESSNIWIVAIDDFHDWIFDTLPKISFTPFVSMEQLWLAFVMKECYNKEWLKEKNEWVSLSESLAQNVKRSDL